MRDPDNRRADHATARRVAPGSGSAVDAAVRFADGDEDGTAYTLRLTLADGSSVEGAKVVSGPGWVLLEQFYPEGDDPDDGPRDPWWRFYNTAFVASAEVVW